MNTEWTFASPRAMTAWTNPTQDRQRITIDVPAHITKTAIDDNGIRRTWVIDHEAKEIVWEPGETKSIPADFDLAIHRVTGCDHGCAIFCRKPAEAGPKAVVSGGLAPLLQRSGQRYGLEACLVARPVAPRSVAIAPGEVAGKLAGAGEEDDPTLERARARRKAAGQ